MPSFDARTARLVGLDILASVLITAIYYELATFDGTDGSLFYTGPVWLGWIIAGAVGVPAAIRRVWPITAVAVVMAGLTAATLVHITREPYLPAAFVLYTVGLCIPPRKGMAVLAAALGVAAAGTAAAHVMALVPMVWLGMICGWAGGYMIRRIRAREGREAAAVIEQIRADERLLIVREVHDIMSHHMTLIAVQAGVGNHVADEHPAEARQALSVIESVSRGALDEMRSMLGILRYSPSTLDPAPGLDKLAELVTRASAGGVAVDLDVAVTVTPPPGVQLAVYRIVQEALTNVVKHAAPATCTVRVEAGPSMVDIEIVDDGATTAAAANGHGLVGMRERAALYGGEFSAGPRPGGGFVVSARLPYIRTRAAV